MKLSTALLALTIGLMTSNVMAASYSLRYGTSTFGVSENKAEYEQAKNNAFANAMKQLEDICIDKHWPSANQMDVTAVVFAPQKLSLDGINQTVTIEVVCRSL